MGCVSEPIVPDTTPIIGNISTRGNSYSENSLPVGSTALFNASGEIIIQNQLFTFDGNYWKGEEDIPWTGTAPTTLNTEPSTASTIPDGNGPITTDPTTETDSTNARMIPGGTGSGNGSVGSGSGITGSIAG